jgi:hypothetical protein
MLAFGGNPSLLSDANLQYEPLLLQMTYVEKQTYIDEAARARAAQKADLGCY